MPNDPLFKPAAPILIGDPGAPIAKAMEHQAAGELLPAKAILEGLLRQESSRADVMALLGTINIQLNAYNEALRLFDWSLRIAPLQAEVHNNRGYCLHKLDRLEAALESFDQAIELGAGFAHRNRAATLADLGRFPEAVEAFDQAILFDPDDADVYKDRVIPLQAERRYADAIASADRALELRPAFAEAYFLKAFVLLVQGDFRAGWDMFEWRWGMREARSHFRRLRVPLWLGDRLVTGKTVLLHAEQGFGDTLQFCRFAPIVAAMGAHVVLEVPAVLHVLMQSLEGDIEVIPKGSTLPKIDMHCPLMSLSKALDLHADDIPAPVPYLHPAPDRVAKWAARLGPRTRPRVGLIWFGSMGGGASNLKSMAFEDILSITDFDVEFYALQKLQRPGDELSFQKSARIIDLGPELGDFADTAAVMSVLDLVISIDTATAHLAGALGLPVWVLLCTQPEWRWPDGTSTPWYPTARLFRQTAHNDWAEPLGRVKAALAEWVASDNGRHDLR